MEQDHELEYEASEQDNVESKVREAQEQERKLRVEYIQKELELKDLYGQLRNITDDLYTHKAKEYDRPAMCDPFLKEYLQEIGEEGLQLKDLKRNEDDEKDYEKDVLLKKLEEINLSQKTPIEYFKALNDVHIDFRCLVEDLNNQIFKCHQDRLLLEDYQTEFNSKITDLRKEIKTVTKKNEELIKSIDMLKSHHS